ncbi:MAG: TonB-dependent receptor, partial [Syntrophaceae bacterium]|nr:TonB-dependent receptor [Syntrophaceae bacterium]
MVGKRVLLWILTVLFVPLLSLNSGAETTKPAAEYQAYDLGDVVVSAEETRVKDITITNVITAEDIKATNSHTVAEALSHAPGVRVTTGAKNQSTVSIQGFRQENILFMIDGVPYYETYFNILDLGSINTDNIAKIEIIKGAPSVLYGANAMGGAVNIVTKKGTEKPFTSASFELSENDTYRVSATHGMKKGIFNYWISYMHEESDGWELSDDFDSKSGYLTYDNKKPPVANPVFENGGDRENSDYEADSVWAKFGIEPNQDSAYYVNFHYRTRDKGVPSNTVANNVFNPNPANGPTFSQFYADRMPDYDEWGLDLDGKQRLTSQLVAKLKLFYHDHEDSLYSYEDPTLNTILARSHYEDWTAGGTFMLDYQPVSWDAIRMAVNYKKDSHKDTEDEWLPWCKYESRTGSIGLENEFTKIQNLSIVVGISYDWFEVTDAKRYKLDHGAYDGMEKLFKPDDDQINPMIGATYTFSDNTRVYASVARKSHFPTLKNLYSGVVVADGDPHLKSEKSTNYTVGVSRPFGTFLKADLGLFYYDIEDKISK